MKFPMVIDGGLSNELERLGCDLNHKLWSANAILKDPDAIITTHLNYLKAGAQCIATASYQATIPGLMECGYTLEKSKHIIQKSVELAQLARNSFMQQNPNRQKPIIAASFGPYGAYLADGSEYLGNYEISDSELFDFHLEKLELMKTTTADLFAFETIPSYKEAVVLSKLFERCDRPVWISFSCQNGDRISDGNVIEKCVSLFTESKHVFAVGVNCTAPKYISELIKRIKKVCRDKRIIIYPNSGEIYHVATKSWIPLKEQHNIKLMYDEWLNEGASIIGGCCRIGPEQISQLAALI
jgi:homocysteine S-methyltransferase